MEQIMKDSPIRFPGLFGDWAFTAPSKALSIGHGVYWYGILIALGVVLAVAVCLRRRRIFGLEEDDILDTLLLGVPLGVLFARLYYVVFYLDLYRGPDGAFRWGDAVAIWDGGLAIYGAVIGAALACLIVARRRKYSFFAMTDLVGIGLFIGQIVGRWGNFMNREAFGAETDLPWRMALTTVSGATVEVHPTFLYESLWNLAGLLLILAVVSRGRRFDGENTCFYFLWYGVGRFAIEGLRTDSLYLFGWELFGRPIRVSQALGLVTALAALAVLAWRLWLRPADPAGLYAERKAAASAPEKGPVKPESSAEIAVGTAEGPAGGAADAAEAAGGREENGDTLTAENAGKDAAEDCVKRREEEKEEL